MLTRQHTAIMCVLLIVGVAACSSFEASIGREEGGATPSAPSDGTRTQVASPPPSAGAPGTASAPPGSASALPADGGEQDGDRERHGASDRPPTIPERIRFAAGATSATVEGTAAEGAHRRYVLEAQEGQAMRIQVTSPSDAVNHGLTAPDGQPIKRVAAEARQGQFELPATGDYVITIASAIDGAAYTLRVEIV